MQPCFVKVGHFLIKISTDFLSFLAFLIPEYLWEAKKMSNNVPSVKNTWCPRSGGYERTEELCSD
jgi:hypothetical protein